MAPCPYVISSHRTTYDRPVAVPSLCRSTTFRGHQIPHLHIPRPFFRYTLNSAPSGSAKSTVFPGIAPCACFSLSALYRASRVLLAEYRQIIHSVSAFNHAILYLEERDKKPCNDEHVIYYYRLYAVSRNFSRQSC